MNEVKNKLEQEIDDLRFQLERKGVMLDEQNISNERRRQETIWFIEGHWDINQDKDGKINGWTITEFLGENWKNEFKGKAKEEIIRVRKRLTKRIDDEINQ